ncbi:MAG: RNA polymerase sigma factor [Acidobacteria bacterium]|nr:RNA polymerase sigma factor [Acidobacteriota bacterium]
MEADQLTGLTDDALVQQFKVTGEPAFFGEIFRRHRAWIFRACLAILRNRDAAADQTQSTFLKALEGIHGFSGGNLRAWLTTIAKHQSISYIRAKNRGPQLLGEEQFPEVSSSVFEDLARHASIDELFAPLNEPQRRCVKLFRFNGLTYEEIAEFTGMDAGAVRSHIQNGMKRMRRSQAQSENK